MERYMYRLSLKNCILQIASSLFAIASLMLFPSLVNGQTGQLRPVRVQLKWVHQFQFAGFYAAIEQGYYQELGMDVELFEGSPETNFIEMVLSGKAEFGVYTTDLIVQSSQGKGIIILAPFFQHSPQVLTIRSESGISNPHALSGKKVMFSPDGETAIIAMLRSEGITLDQIDIVEHSWDVNDLIDGKIDAMSVYLTAEVFSLEASGVDYKLLKPESYGIDFYGDTLFTSEKLLLSSPELVHNFLEATLRGWNYALSHKDEIVDLIIERYGFSGPKEHLEYEAEMIGKLMAENIVEVGHSNRRRWENIITTYHELGMLEKMVDVDALLYDREESLTVIQKRILITFLLILALIISVTLMLFLFNRKLKKEVHKQTRQLQDLNRDLSQSLKEKELLLREIHHRVKNNLQIIGSLISLQHGETDDPVFLQLRTKSMQRIQSMALVHEHLYRSDSLQQIELAGYLEDLAILVEQNMRAAHRCIFSSEMDEQIFASIDISVPLGLIVVELLTNAAKYAINDDGNCYVEILLEKGYTGGEDKRAVLTVKDRGPGIDPDLINTSSTSLGLTLVKTLIDQIGGSVAIENANGASFTIHFPLTTPREKKDPFGGGKL